MLTFKRAVVVNLREELGIRLEAVTVRAASWGIRFLILAGTLAALAVIAGIGRSLLSREESKAA